MTADPVALIEAAYRLDGDEESWLREIARAAEPLLARGLDVTAWTFGPATDGQIMVRARASAGAPEFMRDMVAAYESFDPAASTRMHLAGPCVSTVEVLGEAFMTSTPQVRHVTERYGVRDLVTIAAADPTGHGVGVGVSLDTPARGTSRMRGRWSRLAAHWAAAYRARRALAGANATATLDGAEAVLTPDGKIAHAQAPAQGGRAREALQRAARAVDEARGPLRSRDPDGALDLWRGLFAGRWSLLDVFDSDGRRFIVARRNDAEIPARGGLSTRELQVLAYRAQAHPLKLIAYETGLSVGTVAGHLRSACTKLGVHTPLEIARLFGAPV